MHYWLDYLRVPNQAKYSILDTRRGFCVILNISTATDLIIFP